MPIQRPCLVGNALDMETYEGPEEDMVESEKDELKSYCSLCAHAEEEHQLALSE